MNCGVCTNNWLRRWLTRSRRRRPNSKNVCAGSKALISRLGPIGRAVPIRKFFRNIRTQKNTAETWSGRGKQPHWVQAQLRAGKKLKQFLSHLSAAEVLPFEQNSAEIAGRILADLERAGQPIGRIDPMIAAIALQQGLILVTGNTQHYQRIQALGYKLKLDNWRR